MSTTRPWDHWPSQAGLGLQATRAAALQIVETDDAGRPAAACLRGYSVPTDPKLQAAAGHAALHILHIPTCCAFNLVGRKGRLHSSPAQYHAPAPLPIWHFQAPHCTEPRAGATTTMQHKVLPQRLAAGNQLQPRTASTHRVPRRSAAAVQAPLAASAGEQRRASPLLLPLLATRLRARRPRRGQGRALPARWPPV
jgi:hypothetical protein